MKDEAALANLLNEMLGLLDEDERKTFHERNPEAAEVIKEVFKKEGSILDSMSDHPLDEEF